MTPDGLYVVTKMEKDAYDKPKMERPPFLPPLKVEEEDDEELPDELTCPICNDLIQVATFLTFTLIYCPHSFLFHFQGSETVKQN